MENCIIVLKLCNCAAGFSDTFGILYLAKPAREGVYDAKQQENKKMVPVYLYLLSHSCPGAVWL